MKWDTCTDNPYQKGVLLALLAKNTNVFGVFRKPRNHNKIYNDMKNNKTTDLIAKKTSKCKYCKDPINTGDDIRGGLGIGYWHAHHTGLKKIS